MLFRPNDEGCMGRKPGSAPRGVRQAECERCGWTNGGGLGLLGRECSGLLVWESFGLSSSIFWLLFL